MKKVLVFVVCICAFAFSPYAEGKTDLKTEKDKLSYSLGADLGKKLKSQPIDIDVDIFSKGLRDALKGGELSMTEQEIQDAIMALQKDLAAKQTDQRNKIGDKNKKEGETFLEKNKKKEKVITLPSGLQYKIIKEGTGKKPSAADTVVTNYRGTLIDGTEFDSSYKRGEPATFPVNGVIKGWTEALQLMKEGSKWELVIPSALAYGDRGAGQLIGPNATLIFEIELISIKKKE